MRDRFDLEQDIMNCWNVVDDMKMLMQQDAVNTETIQAITTLYQQKFEALWATFEDCCRTMQLNTKQYHVDEEYDTFEDIGFPQQPVDGDTNSELENSEKS